MSGKGGPYKISSVPDNDNQLLYAGTAGRIQNIFDHQSAAYVMQHLREFGFHPSTLAGGKNYGDRSVCHYSSALRKGHASDCHQQRRFEARTKPGQAP
jgi:hypothetical protein